MGREITKTIPQNVTIEVSNFENIRCSRNCNYCCKEDGLYRCFLRHGEGEDIEFLEDVDDDNFDSSDTYGFRRTDFCLKTFGH